MESFGANEEYSFRVFVGADIGVSGTDEDTILEVTYTTGGGGGGSGATVTYGYDHAGSRVKLNNGTLTTRYPSDAYNIDSTGKQIKHVFAGDAMSLTVEGTGAGATVYYQHTDHLSGQGVTTNTSGSAVETLDYYPYGNIRIDEKTGSFSEQRKYTGHEYDVDTGLSYMEARYYNASTGKFISQDPAFINLSYLEIQLLDPQSWNSYAYARNNPIAYLDPDGEMWNPFSADNRRAISGDITGVTAFLRSPFVTNRGPSPQATKAMMDLATSGVQDVATAINPDAPVKDRVASGALVASNFIPGGKQVQALTKVDDVARVVMNSDDWTKLALDTAAAAKQQAQQLKGVINPTVERYVKKTFQLSDTKPGGTPGATWWTQATGELVGHSDHIQRNWDTLRGGLNILKRETLNNIELRRVKDIVKRAWRANFK